MCDGDTSDGLCEFESPFVATPKTSIANQCFSKDDHRLSQQAVIALERDLKIPSNDVKQHDRKSASMLQVTVNTTDDYHCSQKRWWEIGVWIDCWMVKYWHLG
jgi:hypothetical protein